MEREWSVGKKCERDSELETKVVDFDMAEHWATLISYRYCLG